MPHCLSLCRRLSVASLCLSGQSLSLCRPLWNIYGQNNIMAINMYEHGFVIIKMAKYGVISYNRIISTDRHRT